MTQPDIAGRLVVLEVLALEALQLAPLLTLFKKGGDALLLAKVLPSFARWDLRAPPATRYRASTVVLAGSGGVHCSHVQASAS